MKSNKIEEAFRIIGEKYNFPVGGNNEYISLSAFNTDRLYKQWITYELATGSTTYSGNTDNCNFWFHETRPDMTPDRIIQFVSDLNTLLGLKGQNRFTVRELIDPEDWQEIANINNACSDERYMKN